jgi:predicted enzyme related to lactoylglutathione lyase
MADATLTLKGTFVWEELVTSNVDDAVDFYSSVIGWTFGEPMDTAHSYRLINAGDITVGGAFEHADFTPAWTSYVSVADVDASVGRAQELGATVIREPFDVMDMGRMAVMKDPSGAVINAWQSRDEESPRPAVHGTVCWHELRTTDVDAAREFYAAWLGWSIEPQDMGTFTYWLVFNGAQQLGGIMELTKQMMRDGDEPSHWRDIFQVDDVDAAFAAAVDKGATVLMEPSDIGVGYYAEVIDPLGANFGLMQTPADT